jgi:regulator of nonsense transcripts 1
LTLFCFIIGIMTSQSLFQSQYTDAFDDEFDHSVLEASLSQLDLQDDELEEKSLPEHACTYCGIYATSSVAKCITCSKWFCNAKTPGTGASHLVCHLVKARHKEICLHPQSSLGETVLECYNCGSKNIFSLGFIPAKSDTVVVILCR